jgi:thioredoxin-related protein
MTGSESRIFVLVLALVGALVAEPVNCFAGKSVGSTVDDAWTDNAEQAIKSAKAQDKDVLLYFTGSDWCPNCKKFEQDVLSQTEFLKTATPQFVLVELDFPREKQLLPKIAEQNSRWAERFGVQSYPTIVLIDKSERPFAIFGYAGDGVVNFLGTLGDHHQRRQRRDKVLEEAARASGAERAKLLDQAISEMDQALARLFYEDVVNEIVELDKEDDLGLRTKWNAEKDAEMRTIILTDIMVVSRLERPEKAIGFIDEVLATIRFTPEQHLQVLQIKLNLLRSTQSTEAMDELLDSMIGMEELTDDSRQRLIAKKAIFMVGTGRRDEAMTLLEQSIRENKQSGHLWLAKGQLLSAIGDHQSAVKAFDSGISQADNQPDLQIELIGAKADSLSALDQMTEAIQVLDAFAENSDNPADLRCEAFLHKAMVMRDSGRNRQASLAENRAIQTAGTPEERAEIEKLVEQLRKKFSGR